MAAPSPALDNRLALGGRLTASPRIWVSPAGIPIGRFVLEHEADLPEAGVPRRQRLRIGVRVVGRELCETLKGLSAGDEVRVLGHLTRGEKDSEDYRLLISARRIERLPLTGQTGE